jgi:DnaJ-class molecular chaperone
MNRFEQIDMSRKLLGLGESATRDEIKKEFKKLLHKWHPDKCNDDKEKCEEMTDNIIKAYHTIMDYCENYIYSFSREDVKKQYNSTDWWFDRFGNDPIWG